MTTWLSFRTESVNETMHKTFVNGIEVTCDYLFCNYREEFDSVGDAEDAAWIHEEANNE